MLWLVVFLSWAIYLFTFSKILRISWQRAWCIYSIYFIYYLYFSSRYYLYSFLGALKMQMLTRRLTCHLRARECSPHLSDRGASPCVLCQAIGGELGDSFSCPPVMYEIHICLPYMFVTFRCGWMCSISLTPLLSLSLSLYIWVQEALGSDSQRARWFSSHSQDL